MLELLMSIGANVNTKFKWTINKKWPISVRDPAIAAVNGYLITFGGSRLQEGSESAASYNYPNTMIVYVLATGASARAEAPILGRSSAYAAGWGNKFYVMGGFFASTVDPSLQEYNTSTGAWVTRAALHAAYRTNSLTAHNGYLYATYYDVSAKLSMLYRWNPTTPNNGWVAMASIPGQEYNAGRVVSVGDYLYYFGGRKAGVQASVVFRYNVVANNWTVLPEMPAEFADAKPIALNGKIYLLITPSNGPTNTYSYTEGETPKLVDTSPGVFKPVNKSGIVTWDNKAYIIGGTSSVAPVGLSDQNAMLANM